MKTRNDNRMAWVRNIERLESHPKKTYFTEFEIRSEQRIAGMLNFKSNKIRCSLLSLDPSKEGLYSYNLIVQFADKEYAYNTQADTDGYYSPDGFIGEIVALFSLYYRARFYVAATTTIPTGKSGIKIRHTHNYFHERVNTSLHPPILKLRGGLNWADESLSALLMQVKNMPMQYHHSFALASTHYLRALEEIGKDEEMIFIRLVSAIEAMSKGLILTMKDDNLEWQKIVAMVRSSDFTKEQQEKLLSTLAMRNSRLRFIRFIERYCKGYFKGGRKMPTTRIKRSELPDRLNAIYNARSRYLHRGDRMYLSIPMSDNERWDMDPSQGMGMDNRQWNAQDKLPYPWFFEGLVRHCLLNFLSTPLKN